MISCKVKVERTITERRVLELSYDQVCVIVKNWARCQGFDSGARVELTENQGMADGAIISQTIETHPEEVA